LRQSVESDVPKVGEGVVEPKCKFSAGAAEPVDDFDWKINASFQLRELSNPDQGSLRNCPPTPKCLATMITPTIAAAVANSPAEPNSGIAELPIISILVASLV
jgi:hypothetical protein